MGATVCNVPMAAVGPTQRDWEGSEANLTKPGWVTQVSRLAVSDSYYNTRDLGVY